ncbi:MAG: GGDEF domain-containing protein [Clostridium sp.]|uniref:sensor domain-containing diguanylate cyclase n=1 Tax=Clostridium sp. TaxID=1506 RepID=UPI0025BCA11A|nr:sensor domain-containing diguanylate cyclase [Clostridium sp.]MCF0148244.1 GGDEF domain-containing protein [Clostridium sp.]
MKKPISLRSIFTLSFSIIIVTLILVITFVINTRATEIYKNQIGSTLSQLSYQMSDKLDHYMWSRYREVSLLSKIEAFNDLENKTEIRSLIEELQDNASEYAWIGVLDVEGNVVISTDGILEGKNISARPVYNEALTKPFIGDVHEAVLLANLLPNPTGEEMKFVDISIPIKDEGGELKGILATHLSWKWAKEIEDSLMNSVENRNDIDLFILSKDNTVLLGPHEMLGEKIELEKVNTSKGNNKGNCYVQKWKNGEEYLTGYSVEHGYKNYKGLGWTVLVRKPLDIAYKPVVELRNFIIIIGLVLAVIFALIGLIIARLIANPLKKIALSAEKLKSGERVEIPEYNGIKDIELLSVSLKSLINSLINTEHALGEMEGIAHNDQLTELANRKALIRYFEKIKAKVINENKIYTIYYLDLDGFKLINDTYGHESGDLILKEVAKRLNFNIKEDFVARLGGDEFILVKSFKEEELLENSTTFANLLIEEIRKPYIIQGNTMTIGCSIGGAFYPIHGEDPMEVMKLADKCLYTSKSEGKNKYTYFNIK